MLTNRSHWTTPRTILIGAIVAVALMRFVLVFVHEANWDEYLNLSMIYDHQRGDLREILQTGFVHLFGWVTYVSDNEANQIIAARVVYLAVGLMTSLAIWKTARALVTADAAFFTVLCYWGFSYNLVHGVSLRTDPLAASAMMCALWLVVARPLGARAALFAGALAGLAGVFTIKAIFYIPALVIIALLRAAQSRTVAHGILLVALAGIAALACFVGLTALHAATFADISSPLGFLDRTTGTTLAQQDYAILIRYALAAGAQNVVLVIVLLVGLFGLIARLSNGEQRISALIGFALLTPLLSVLIYRDAYPYFYPFILAPVMVLAGFAWDYISQRFDPKIPIMITTVICLGTAIITVKITAATITTQRETLNVIHRLFPNDPTYIDGRSMVSSLPKRGLFMSAWGMADYRRNARPVMADVIQDEQPQFLLANTWQLDLNSMTPAQSNAQPFGLLAEDMAILQDNYVPFWGPLFVPGKTLDANDRKMQILISGTYRLTSETSVSIGGQSIDDGAEIYLAAGDYDLAASGESRLVLSVEQPNIDPPIENLFGGF